MAYDRLEPDDSLQSDFRNALLAATVVNVARSWAAGSKRRPDLVSPMDFMPKWGEDTEGVKKKSVQSVDEMKNFLKSLVTVKKDKTKRERKDGVPRRSNSKTGS